MVCAHCGSESHRTGSSDCPNYCTLCKVTGHRQKRAECPFRECSKCKGIGHSARACKAPQLQQRMVRGERVPENDHIQSDAPMATDGDRHADDDECECECECRKFADWEHVKQTCDSIGAQQLLELKRVTSDFQKDRMREHKSIQSKLNKRTEAPVNFAFTENYDRISVAKCRFCKAWLFRPDATQKNGAVVKANISPFSTPQKKHKLDGKQLDAL